MSNNFDDIYSESTNTYGDKPSPIVEIAVNNIEAQGYFLDLGCGYGRDALPLGLAGFKVEAIDISKVAIDHLKQKAKEISARDVEAFCSDIRTFEIEQNKYSFIYSINSISFIGRNDAIALIERIKSSIKPGGVVAISAMTEDDEFFDSAATQDLNTFFKKGELGKLFFGFEIINYFETITDDLGHPGSSHPHVHGFAKIIARKKSDN